MSAVACLYFLTQLSGHETGINYVDKEMYGDSILEDSITMRVLKTSRLLTID